MCLLQGTSTWKGGGGREKKHTRMHSLENICVENLMTSKKKLQSTWSWKTNASIKKALIPLNLDKKTDNPLIPHWIDDSKVYEDKRSSWLLYLDINLSILIWECNKLLWLTLKKLTIQLKSTGPQEALSCNEWPSWH